jgi:uncharacterized protein YigE (DUF2233 family)
MRFLLKIITGIIAIFACQPVFAVESEFQVMTKQALPNQLGTFQQVEFNAIDGNDPVTFYAATFNQRYHARVFQQEGEIQFFANYMDTLSESEDFIVATNGGFYRHDFTPAGLFIENGNVIRKAAHDSLLRTCIAINKKQKISLETNLNDCEHALYAMQTGPLLISDGKVNDGIATLQQKLPQMHDFFVPHKRTIVALSEKGELISIVTSPATLLDTATILQDYPDAFGVSKIKIAVALDGGSSTGMYVRFSDQPFYYQELKHVKTFLFIK